MMRITDMKLTFASPQVYAAYRDCMFHPTWEGFLRLAEDVADDPALLVLGATERQTVLGVLVLSCTSEAEGEITGLSVLPERRGQGVGRRLIEAAAACRPCLTAETDKDAVGFYRSCGFNTTPQTRIFPQGSVVRYLCRLTRLQPGLQQSGKLL